MPSKSKNPEPATSPFWLTEPWVVSGAIHAGLIALAFLLALGSTHLPRRDVDIDVIESPKLAPQPIQMTQPQAPPKKPRGHEVFGLSRKSLSSPDGETVKAGNTVAKTPDQEKLRPNDADSLPIPSEEYLISQMPRLKVEVRIPYPVGARKRGIQGAVVMDLLIDSLGKVRDAQLIGGPDSELNSAALEAARTFQFTPALIQEKPVAVKIRYSYRFILEH